MNGADTRSSQLRGVVVPMGVVDVLLPNAAVAEIVGYQDPAPYVSAPGWLLGALTWRGFTLPLVSLTMAGEEPVEAVYGQRARSVICYTPSGNSALPYVGIAAVGPPRLARLSAQALEPIQLRVANPFVLHGLTYAERPAWIPDMDAIERAVLEAMPS